MVDENGEENLGRYDRRVNSEVVTDCFSGSVTGQRMVGETLYFLNTDGVGSSLCVDAGKPVYRRSSAATTTSLISILRTERGSSFPRLWV